MDFDSPAGIAQRVYLMLNPDFQPCPPFQSAVTEELIKWVMLMEWTGRPLHQSTESRAENLQHFKFINLANGWGHAHQTDTPTLSRGYERSYDYVEFLALPPFLFALQAERLSLVSANSDRTPHRTHLRLLDS